MADPGAERTLDLLLQANRLKITPRAGWAVRGLHDVESVADHSYGVAFVALILAELISEPVDREKVLTIALIHDLPETEITDIPAPALRYFPPGAKQRAELNVLAELLDGFHFAQRPRAWWEEFENRTSAEGRLVRDADRLELLLQAHAYELASGNKYLVEFWAGEEERPFEFGVTRSVYQALRMRGGR